MEFILTNGVEFGKEKSESLLGLSDKEIEDKVTGLVKTGIWKDGSPRARDRNVYIWVYEHDTGQPLWEVLE